MSALLRQQDLMDQAVQHIVSNYSPRGNRVAWLMLASILVDAWDFNTIALVLVFIREQFNPDPLMLGLAAGGTQAGAVIGALVGGRLTDRLGRRVMFLTTMVIFIVFGVAQAFVPSIGMLVVVRCILGLALGSDIATGFAYIMECMPKGQREVMSARWQFAFSMGQVFSLIFLIGFLLAGVPHAWIWRATLGLGALPALLILLLRWDLPETSMWLVRQGRFREAKEVSRKMYNDSLTMLPDVDVTVTKPKVTEFLVDTARDPLRRRATYYSWLACFCQSAQFATFGFYVPVLLFMLGVSSMLGTNLILLPVWILGALGGIVAPLMLPRVGHKGVGKIGFGTVLCALLVAAWGLYTGNSWIVPFAAAVMIFAQNIAASNVMVIPTLVAKAEYRGQASGFAYMFSRSAAFMSIFLFPYFTAAVGQANATMAVAIFPLAGLLAAFFLLPEVYGYQKS